MNHHKVWDMDKDLRKKILNIKSGQYRLFISPQILT